MARPLSPALHIQGLAVLVEQSTRKRAGQCFGWPFAMCGCLIAQSSLDLFPKVAADYWLVLPWMAFLLVGDFAEIDRVRQHLVQSPARKLPASRSHAFFRHPDFGDDPATLQIVSQEPDGTECQISLMDVFHRRGFGAIDHQSAIADVVSQWRHPAHPHSLALGGGDLVPDPLARYFPRSGLKIA
jgi:hypothetical protein